MEKFSLTLCILTGFLLVVQDCDAQFKVKVGQAHLAPVATTSGLRLKQVPIANASARSFQNASPQTNIEVVKLNNYLAKFVKAHKVSQHDSGFRGVIGVAQPQLKSGALISQAQRSSQIARPTFTASVKQVPSGAGMTFHAQQRKQMPPASLIKPSQNQPTSGTASTDSSRGVTKVNVGTNSTSGSSSNSSASSGNQTSSQQAQVSTISLDDKLKSVFSSTLDQVSDYVKLLMEYQKKAGKVDGGGSVGRQNKQDASKNVVAIKVDPSNKKSEKLVKQAEQKTSSTVAVQTTKKNPTKLSGTRALSNRSKLKHSWLIKADLAHDYSLTQLTFTDG